MSVDRRWSAKIQVGSTTSEVVDASQSEFDLQADQAKVAIREASEYIKVGLGNVCYVTLYKTTGKGTAQDKNFTVCRDSAGQIKAQR